MVPEEGLSHEQRLMLPEPGREDLCPGGRTTAATTVTLYSQGANDSSELQPVEVVHLRPY